MKVLPALLLSICVISSHAAESLGPRPAPPPDSAHDYVADPSQGSRHNRGCAVDLTLYDLATGAEVRMPGRYVLAADGMALRPSGDGRAEGDAAPLVSDID
jgi:D-alanyl-D-alanine dipeptidase